MTMVKMVRSGIAQREVARHFQVSLDTIQRWVERGDGLPLNRVDWSDRSKTPHRIHNRTSPELEQLVLRFRHRLASSDNPLGFVGPDAIHEALCGESTAVPSSRTIARILKRHGMLDGKIRQRHSAPPPGWYLPDVAKGMADIDAFDIIEGLVIEGQGEIEVLTSTALWASHVQAWPLPTANAHQICDCLASQWFLMGLPIYAQFDNDTRFQGPHSHPDVISRVMRMCLSLGVTPVFVPPRETGFQASIERFNGLWQNKVWHRFHHDNLSILWERSERFIRAYEKHRAARSDRSPDRVTFPKNWTLNLQAHPQGRVIYVRRTDAQGHVHLLGRLFPVDPNWCYRLVRCEVDLTLNRISVFRLRRRNPNDQPLLKTIEYHLPKRRFNE